VREEHDMLGVMQVPADRYWGIHTQRALENFVLSGRPMHPELIRSLGWVKWACARVNRRLGAWHDERVADAIEDACREMAEGGLREFVPVDALQGGAGTSANMNVNEVLSNRALELIGASKGDYHRIHPLDDLNLHQSTNDVVPTAIRLAAIRGVRELDRALVRLQESFQSAERRFDGVLKVGRTQLQDAVLTTMGRSMSAYAEAFGRDRWRVYKCEERLRVVNLGGTAIGTAITAPRAYVFRVSDELRALTGIGFARAENLVDATQNADVFAEVSGILKACAVSMVKVCTDLRLMASGPEAGLGELRLPPRQAGSSIMPGKVNPVIPEAATQAAMKVMGNDLSITMACAHGNLELNAFLPLVAECLLESLDLLRQAALSLATLCVDGMLADEERCRSHVEGSTAVVTALVPALGYERACELALRASRESRSVRDLVVGDGLLSDAEFDALISVRAVMSLGEPSLRRGEQDEAKS
jgi:aspartate ammonia-lyase